MANELVTAAQFKSYLGIDDAVDDTTVGWAVTAASRQVESWCDRQFYQSATATTRTFEPTSGTVVTVDDISTTTGLVVATDDNDDGTAETTWASTDYQLGPLNNLAKSRAVWRIEAIEGRRFPTGLRRPAVHVTAQWGWPAVPDEVFQATLIQASRLFKRKDAPHGVAGIAEFGEIRLSRIDHDVQQLLQPFRRVWVL